MAKKIIKILKNKNCIADLLDDVYYSLTKIQGQGPKSEVFVSGVDERNFVEADTFAILSQIVRLYKKGIHERIMVQEGDFNFFIGQQTAYRWVAEKNFSPNPIYVYGNKIALVVWGPPRQIVIIDYEPLADSYRKQFLYLWKHPKVPKMGKEEKIKRRKMQRQIMRHYGLNYYK